MFFLRISSTLFSKNKVLIATIHEIYALILDFFSFTVLYLADVDLYIQAEPFPNPERLERYKPSTHSLHNPYIIPTKENMDK